ncbi:MAG: sulfite exporter TauE/SafE family protein [Bacteroidota bacterium]
MILTILIPAFLLGLTGSFHCVGMCGPIGLSIPVQKKQSKFTGTLLYLIGKTITYTLLGLVFGLFGRQFMIAGLQQWLSVSAGIVLLFVVVVMLVNAKQYHENKLTAWISDKLLPLFRIVLKNPGKGTPLYMGMLNGLLPCGLVYIGIIGSLATGSAVFGSLFMLAFGIGTAPVMLSFLLMAKQFNINYRQRLQKLTPVFISFVAIVLILRGLNLGIPYLSPVIQSLPAINNADAIICH